ncbi:TPA: hypothetical protein ACH3X1_009056 [Trebouxia sp. C0004]
MTSHDRANKQAEMDVSLAMGDMLTEMQGCLKQLCGSSVVGDPEAVAQLIAEKVAAMNISPGPNGRQDSDVDVLALPAPDQAPAPEVHVAPSAEAQACTTGMIQAPPLYNTSGNISSVQLAWSEWSFGSTTIAERVKKIKTDNTQHRKNRHLPQLIESMILAGASEATAVSLVVQMAEHMALTLDQMREGPRLLTSHTAKQDHHALTAETSIILRQYRQAVQWAHQQITSKSLCQQGCSMFSEAEAHLRQPAPHIS